MTAQGREIITGIQILPPTGYGPFHFRHEIRKEIERVMGTRKHTDLIMARMTDQGILKWSSTGKMAKVIDPEQTFRIMMCSEGGTRKVMYSGLTEEQAYDICRDYGWKASPDGGYVWRLEIEEE